MPFLTVILYVLESRVNVTIPELIGLPWPSLTVAITSNGLLMSTNSHPEQKKYPGTRINSAEDAL